MKVGIMQPYLFPYIGYFQLISVVDKFVIHDDVQYIKGGWINRNRIQINNNDYLFTFSLKRDSSLKNINARQFSDQFTKEKINFLKIVQNNYKRAPYFLIVNDLMSNILDYKELNISSFITYSLKLICNYLEIKTPFYLSSKLNKNNEFKGQDRVINICQALKATVYINPIGGKILYSKDTFDKNNISLFFIKSSEINYEFKKVHYIPNLSIIDLMMFNSIEEIKKILKNYDLLQVKY
jgi:hypothetical protein